MTQEHTAKLADDAERRPPPLNPPASEATLRDLFAGQAMMALLQASPNAAESIIAKASYDQADAMLAHAMLARRRLP